MKFLNTSEETKLGKGLDMEMTSSLFFYNAFSTTFSYYDGVSLDAKRSAIANRIENYLTAGYFDTNHSFGDFEKQGQFTRGHALKVYDQLQSLKVSLPIFSNHGGVCISPAIGGGSDQRKGDIPSADEYHSDLFRKNGIEFLTLDNDTMMNDLKPSVTGNRIKRKLIRFFEKPHNKELILQTKLLDQNIFKSFVRLRGTGKNAPNLSSLKYQLELIDWDNFYRNSGAVVLYQHLGVLYRHNNTCYSATIEEMKNRAELFLSPFYFLHKENKSGRLWICATIKLLRYIEMISNIQIKLSDTEHIFHINMNKEIKSPQEYFQGLTLYLNSNNPVTIQYKGKSLPIVHNGPDKSGKYSISIPFLKKENIWN